MIDYVNIGLTVLFSQNLLLVFAFAFGAEPKAFLKPKHAFFTGLNLTLMLTALTPLSRLVHQLLGQLGLSVFSLLCDSVLAMMGTFVLGRCLERCSPDLWSYVGDASRSLPTNAAVLGTLLLAAQRNYTVAEAAVFGLFGGLGALVALVSLVGIRQKLSYGNSPRAFQWMPILFITAGLMSMSLVGFYGLHIPSP